MGGVNEATQVPNGDVNLGVRVGVTLPQVSPFKSLHEVYLHVVHEQYSSGGVHRPAHAVAVFTVNVGVGLDFGQCHDSPGSCLWVVCAAQAVHRGGRSSEWVLSSEPLAPTAHTVSLRLSHNHLRACLDTKVYLNLNKNASPPAPPLIAQRAERAGKHSDQQKRYTNREFGRESSSLKLTR